jgi:hypothetical protein
LHEEAWARHVACMGRDEKCIQILVRKPEEKTPLGKPRGG